MENNELIITEDKSRGEAAWFILKGRVNAVNAPAALQQLEKALRNGRTHIVVNMNQVEYLSSAGIRVLLSMYKKAKACGGKLRVENPSENVINVLGLTALDEMLFK